MQGAVECAPPKGGNGGGSGCGRLGGAGIACTGQAMCATRTLSMPLSAGMAGIDFAHQPAGTSTGPPAPLLLPPPCSSLVTPPTTPLTAVNARLLQRRHAGALGHLRTSDSSGRCGIAIELPAGPASAIATGNPGRGRGSTVHQHGGGSEGAVGLHGHPAVLRRRSGAGEAGWRARRRSRRRRAAAAAGSPPDRGQSHPCALHPPAPAGPRVGRPAALLH